MTNKKSINNQMYIVGLIPARSGSKGIKNKNIKILKDKPLIYYTIKQSLDCKFIDETIVSTDCENIAKISREYGAKTPFLRPIEISGDFSTDYEFVYHYLEFLKSNNKRIPDLIVQLRPTCPNRNMKDLNDSLKIMIKEFNNYDSLRSVNKLDKSPFKMYLINDNALKPLFEKYNDMKEPYNQCRQVLPQAYLHNGYIDIIKPSVVFEKKSITGDIIYPYIMDFSSENIIDIDTDKDWEKFASNDEKN